VLTDHDLVTDKYVEAGAELVGENHPLWWEFASVFGLQLVPLTTPEDYESRGLAVRLRLGDHDLTPDERLQVDADLLPVVDAIGQDAKDVDPSSRGLTQMRPLSIPFRSATGWTSSLGPARAWPGR
jgi:monoamine oxidase